ncbi:Tail-specific protease precursor [Planctomycetes bacterium Pan216]|uniref:Tail-specific protease n=1 Tax=Kolteria novifilia TaxID=2527975 RepID=A0A518B717_9BACT|nr:Tail-specific protease precursor [Planctomycetes bacterium Pan216]
MNRRRNQAVASSAALLIGLALAMSARADVERGDAKLSDIARRVCLIMQQGHISGLAIDDTISRRVHGHFLEMFDPLKLYFMQEDIDGFENGVLNHDEDTIQGDLTFPFAVYQRFLKRLDQRVGWAREFAKNDFDFDKEEEIVLDPDTATYAKTEEESKDRWRRRVKYELLQLMIDGKTEEEARERIDRRYRNHKRRWHQINNEELAEMFLTSVANSFDPHSAYMSPTTLEDFKISMELSLEGIGALLQSEDGYTIVKEIVPGGAADADGRLKPGDKIIGVGQGGDGELVDIRDMKLRDVVKLIRGKAGTIVRLEVTPASSDKAQNYDLTRQRIELKDRAAKGEVITLPGTNDMQYKVGVINLPSFYAASNPGNADPDAPKSATIDVQRILGEFNQEGVDAVVLDLRANGGGLLSEAIGLTGLFIDEGPVVQVKGLNNEVQSYFDESPGVAYSGPLVVLTSRFSASASEIFAGAIQDYGRGIVVGDSQTHGKGTVQRVIDVARQFRGFFPDMGAVKLTMQKFYRVNGDSTQNRGVVADVVLPSITDHEDFSESKLDHALEFDRIRPARFNQMGTINGAMIAQLQKMSKQRQDSEVKLAQLHDRKKRVHDRRGRKVLLFSEAKLRAERDQLSDEEKKELEELQNEDGEKKDKPFGEDTYTKEVLSITSDLIRLQNGALTAR